MEIERLTKKVNEKMPSNYFGLIAEQLEIQDIITEMTKTVIKDPFCLEDNAELYAVLYNSLKQKLNNINFILLEIDKLIQKIRNLI